MHVVHQVRAGMDNTFYMVGDDQRKEGVVIDPFDGDSALKAVERIGWRPLGVINTHGHWDHVGGNDALREQFGISMHAHPLEEVPHASALDKQIDIAGVTYDVLHTPGHRPGHVCLRGAGNLFTGDTLFVAGSGNPRFGGDVNDLYESFWFLAGQDDDLWIHPGHDYAAKNLSFSRQWEPDNPAIDEAVRHFKDLADRGETHRSRLGDEKRWNLFFRLDSAELRRNLQKAGHIEADAGDAEVFKALRELRNTF